MGDEPRRSSGKRRLAARRQLLSEPPMGRDHGLGWLHNRDAALQELRNSGLSERLVQAASERLYNVPISWRRDPAVCDHPALVELGRVPDIPKMPDEEPSSPWPLSDVHDAVSRSVQFEEIPRLPNTVSELLSALLHWEPRALSQAERSKRQNEGQSRTPVRDDGMLSRRAIGEIAADILDQHEAGGHPPGRQLTRLIRALVEADRPMLDQTRNYSAMYAAATALAKDATLSVRALAAKADVEPSTISRWRRDPRFQRLTAELHEIYRRRDTRLGRET
jgi:hypothetical protein